MRIDSLSHYIQNYFLSYLIAQRGYGDNTVASYRDTFRLLFRFLENEGKAIAKLKLTDLDQACILKFLQWLEDERGNAISTRNVRLAHFKSFYGFVLSLTPELADHCTQVINSPFKKTEKKPPAYLTEPETEELLDKPNSSTRLGLRHTAILALLYDSACRVQELIDLNVSDVTLGRISKIFVKGKGGKYREIPILPETGKILRRYISAYNLNPENALFVNKQGNRLTRAGIAHIMKKYSDPASHSRGISPHLLRHSKATHLVNHGAHIYSVRDFLGHASVTTTQVYITSNPEVTRTAIENVASKTVPDSTSYYSPKEKADLITFLDELI